MYAFLFDKKSLTLVVLGFSLVGLGLFGAGLAVGTHWGPDTPNDELQWAAMAQEAKIQPLLPPGVGTPPAPTAESPSTGGSLPPAPPAAERSAKDEPWDRAMSTALPTPQKPDDGTGTTLSSPPIDPTDSTTPPALATTATPSAPSSAATSTSSADGYVEAGSYVVQVGTFTHLTNAERRREEMEGHGYRADVQTVRNSKGNLFYAVRIGHYAELRVALEIATVIRRQLRLAPDDDREVSVLQLPTEQDDSP